MTVQPLMQTGETKEGSVSQLRVLTKHGAGCIIACLCLRVFIDLSNLRITRLNNSGIYVLQIYDRINLPPVWFTAFISFP